MKTTKEIQATTINRVSDKSGKFLGYLVKSNSSDNYYQVTWNESATRYECNCAATCKCCHIKAVEQVQATKAQLRPRYQAIIDSKQQAPTHEGEGKLPQETQQKVYNWKQSISGDAMEREYEENRRSYQRMMESEY